MAYYVYKAIDSEGNLVKGTIEALDVSFFYDIMQSSHMNILSVKEANTYILNMIKRYNARKVKRREIIEFSNNLSTMLRSGLPLLTILEDIASTTENKYFAEKIRSVKSQVEFGASFSDAVAGEKEIFPDILIRLVRIGEETGNLPKNLNDIANHLQRMEDLSSTIKRSLLYPAFAIVSITGALFFWLIYVLPKIMDLFQGMNIELPLVTRILLVMSDFTKAYWYTIFIIPILFYLSLKIMKKFEGPRYILDKAKIRLPIIKLITYNMFITLFTEQMRMLVNAGMTIERSLELLEEIIGNEVFKRAIRDVRERVTSGSRIADALRMHTIFPMMVVRMVSMGEESGSLSEQFGFLSEYFFKKLDDASQKIGKVIEPLVILVIGFIFILIIVGLLLPIYDLIADVGGP